MNLVSVRCALLGSVVRLPLAGFAQTAREQALNAMRDDRKVTSRILHPVETRF